MSGINVKRWLAGGVAAAALIWVLEGVSNMLVLSGTEEVLRAHGLTLQFTASMWILTILISLVAGLALVFFYAAARPRFGPGPRTAIIVAVVLWAAGPLVSILGYQMIGLYPSPLLVHAALVGLVEWILAALLGAWVYREA